MNFNGFDFDNSTQTLLSEMERGSRLPHALIIESADAQKAAQLATLLSMFAVCTEEVRPCGVCKGCVNARRQSHPDILVLPLPPKKKQYSVEQMRDLIKDAYILPNEAGAKVYILQNCDEWFPPLPQNTFLKLSEEPPQNVFFILLCKSAQSLLPTILSRFTVIRLRSEEHFDEAADSAAEAIADGILSSTEYPLLKALNVLTDKEQAGAVIAAVRLRLRDAVAVLSGGEALGSEDTAQRLAGRLTRKKLLEMMELCDSSLDRIKQNGNINLLITWMCGEFRRITWQR